MCLDILVTFICQQNTQGYLNAALWRDALLTRVETDVRHQQREWETRVQQVFCHQ